MVSVWCRIEAPWPNTSKPIRLINQRDTKVPIESLATALDWNILNLTNTIQSLNMYVPSYRTHLCILLKDVPLLLQNLGWPESNIVTAVAQLDFNLGTRVNDDDYQKKKAVNKKRTNEEIIQVEEQDDDNEEEEEEVYTREMLDAFAKEITPWLGMNGLAIMQTGKEYEAWRNQLLADYVNSKMDTWKQDLEAKWISAIKKELWTELEPELRRKGVTPEEEKRINQQEGHRVLEQQQQQQPPRKEFK